MILVIQGKVLHYRRAFLNALSEIDDVTVVHSGSPSKRADDCFSEVILPVRKIGPFMLQRNLIRLIAQRKPKTVIAMFDVRWAISVRAMFKFDHIVNWVWWGLDKGKSVTAFTIKIALANRQNPVVFYNHVIRDEFSPYIYPKEKLFVANNTFHVSHRSESFRHPTKTRIINVGSLDARKQNDVTIRALHTVLQEMDTEIRFTLIGVGAEMENLRLLVEELGMQDHVELVGNIEDPKLLEAYYADALASVSFGQAGLAVLQSMAFGVPFVTKHNSISGGEKYNISDGVNGILCDDEPKSLEDALRVLISSPDYARELGEAAYLHYSQKATIENMVATFKKAIEYCESHNG